MIWYLKNLKILSHLYTYDLSNPFSRPEYIRVRLLSLIALILLSLSIPTILNNIPEYSK